VGGYYENHPGEDLGKVNKNIKYIPNTSRRYDSLTVTPSFLLISLNMDAILGEVTLNRRRRKLEEMTKGKGLGDAYDATLSRIKAQSGSRSKLGMEVLMWVSHAERPLQADELCHALGVEQESTDLDIWNIPTIKTLLACSLGLITVENSSSTIQLVHYTLHEYLSHNPNLFLKPHSTIAEACLTYLNFPHVRGFSPGLSSPPPTAPLVEYASCHWGTHAKRETTESVKTLALKLLDGYDKHISSKILLLRGVGLWNPPIDWEGTPKGFTGLHGAAYLGCVEVTAALLESGRWDAQATDFNGNTAIAWAARMGHEGVVRVLLGRRDTNPDKADRWGQTPLLWAAEKGHEGVVRALLERSDVNPNTADEYGRTPFSGAAMNGHEVVVRMLLERKDVDPNTADTEDGRTPLSFAAQNGHVGVVKMLLEREDVDPNKPDQSNVTPLSRAAQNGHLGVVKTLLERKDVDPNIADTEDGRTPLSFAAENGYVGVVKYLLEREEVDPNTADTEYGQTPLSFAAMNGHEGAVSILLNRNDVDPGITDNWNSTPLSWAATYGHEGIIRLLQESRI